MDVELVVDLGLFKTNPCDLDLGCGPITKRDPALNFHIASPCCAVSGGFYPKIGSQSPNFPIFRSENGLTSM
jgi:hypothetical protein